MRDPNWKPSIFRKIWWKIEKIWDAITVIPSNIRMICQWIPILWSNWDWDYVFFLKIMRYKLQRMSKHIRTEQIIGDADKVSDEMDECIQILDRLLGNYNYIEEAHKILKASGIKRPAMYDLGYNNNNCIGCVKGGMGYWNHIRIDFPEVFEARAKMERLIGASCIRGVYLDELDPERGRHTPPVVEDCGVLCEAIKL